MRTGRSKRAFCSTDLMLANMVYHVVRFIRLAAIPPMPPRPPPPPHPPVLMVEKRPLFSLAALIFDLIVSNSSSTFLCGPRSHCSALILGKLLNIANETFAIYAYSP